MSDHAKSVREIEDVLVSIRRLVSENHAATIPSMPPVAEPARLVLTEAHRVSEPDDPWAPVPSPPAEITTSEDGPEDPAWGLEDRLSDWGEIEGSAEEAVEDAIAEQSDPSPPMPTLPTRAQAMPDRDTDGPDFFDFESETGDSNWPDQGASRAVEDLALVRGHVPRSDTYSPTVTPAAMSEPADDSAATTPERPEEASDQTDIVDLAETTPSSRQTEPESEPVAAVVDDPQDADADADTGAKPTEEVTPVFSRKVEVRRPSQQEEEATSLVASEDATTARAVDDEDDEEIEDLGDDPQPFTFPETEDGVLDEETLREIIAEVVREELQGALGQRITRNVRKMVRREIRLALAAQDLE